MASRQFRATAVALLHFSESAARIEGKFPYRLAKFFQYPDENRLCNFFGGISQAFALRVLCQTPSAGAFWPFPNSYRAYPNQYAIKGISKLQMPTANSNRQVSLATPAIEAVLGQLEQKTRNELERVPREI